MTAQVISLADTAPPCAECGTRKTPSAYFDKRDNKRRVAYRCKPCVLKRNNAYRKRVKERDKSARRLLTLQHGKECRKCHTAKAAAQFSDNKYGLDGFSRVCRDCNSSSAKKRYDRTQYDPHKQHAAGIWSNYRLRKNEYEELLAAQGHACATCRKPHYPERYKKLMVDHDHKTGRVRGLLCGKCNSGIGYFNDNPAAFRFVAEYLERSALDGWND